MPTLDPSLPITCAEDTRGVPIRAQCDTPATGEGVCWVAPACREGMQATASDCQRLDHVRYCEWPEAEVFQAVLASHRVVPARTDIERGWWRDEVGRIFQVGFDLNRRFWIGGRWLASFGDGGDGGQGTPRQDLTGGALELGFRVDALNDWRSKTRFGMFETDLTLSPFSLRANFMRVDSSTDGDEPFLTVTTFVGEPARHDIYLTAGWWGELMTVDHRPRGSRDDTFLRLVAAGMTWDLWHDADMTSYLRLRGGLAVDDLFHRGEDAVVTATPLIYLESDLTFDDAGFHHLRFSSGYEAVYFDAGDGLESVRRFQNELAYELILIAISDQPVTLRVAAAGGYRDDLRDPRLNGWEATVTAGLRFSLWAPPRDLDARDRAIAERKERAQ